MEAARAARIEWIRPSMTKTVVYLDQSYLSNMTKARLGKEAFPRTPECYFSLFDALVDAVRSGVVLCPISSDHFTESELAPQLEQRFYDTLEELCCGVSFLPFTDVVENQVSNRYKAFLNTPTGATLTWRDVFDCDPEGACDGDYRIERSRGVFASWTRAAREYHETVGLLAPIGDFEVTKRNEIVQFLHTLYLGPLFAFLAGQANIFTLSGPEFLSRMIRDFREVRGGDPAESDILEALTKFLLTLVSDPPPYIDVYSSIVAFIVTRYQERRVHGSDLQDVMAASMALPFCSIFTCDGFMKDVIRSLGLHERYGCDIYSPRVTEVNELISVIHGLNQKARHP